MLKLKSETLRAATESAVTQLLSSAEYTLHQDEEFVQPDPAVDRKIEGLKANYVDSCRVAGWRHKILPLIEEQDARGSFHIHNYGDRILDRLTQLSLGPRAASGAEPLQLPAAPIALASVLSDTNQWEVSRCHSVRSHSTPIPTC